jgi:hypothetical protein
MSDGMDRTILYPKKMVDAEGNEFWRVVAYVQIEETSKHKASALEWAIERIRNARGADQKISLDDGKSYYPARDLLISGMPGWVA